MFVSPTLSQGFTPALPTALVGIGTPTTLEFQALRPIVSWMQDCPDPGSFEEIFKDYSPFVWRALRHLGVAEADLADQCQEVFLTIHRKLDSFERRSAFKSWVYGICLRRASDYRRRAYIRRETAVSEPPQAKASSASDSERLESRALLQALLATLSDDKREVFVLFELEGLPMQEIANLLGIPLQTAYSRLRLARQSMVSAYHEALAVRSGGAA